MAQEILPDVPSTWPPPNYVNPERKGNGLMVQLCILMVLTLSILAMRIYSRVFLRRIFGIDDWLILPAIVLFQAVCILTILGWLRYGYGTHAWDLRDSTRERALLFSWLSEMIVTLCLMFTKLSICTFYLRLLGGTNSRWTSRTIYALMTLIVIWGIGFTVAIILQCYPAQAVFRVDSARKCVNRYGGVIAHAAIDIGTDFLIYALPIPKMLKLQVPLRQKLLLVGLFALGAFVCTASILRLPATVRSMTTYDVMWYVWKSYLWTTLECGLGIIVACIPSITPLLLRFTSGFAPAASHNTPPKPPASSKFRNALGKALPNLNAAHSYPLANISTTVTGVGNEEWWNESDENMIRRADPEEDGAIMKTTVIEQTVSGEMGKARR
ncbi:hypothetical protein FN846DRAFT_912909 [Sphaerosporella brunnea]|uniref:Rhodopsin domain-containing protein n=1 Tax=Sphaerosporella brunnea TaxID=1250544 RepID=A0A5J5EFI5_9PEZI|nr:hypothetical protein FN846DRAFT_912909 [Sphaerosporella brunnea]